MACYYHTLNVFLEAITVVSTTSLRKCRSLAALGMTPQESEILVGWLPSIRLETGR